MAVGPVRLFDKTVAQDGHELIFVPDGRPPLQYVVDLRRNDGPNLLPAVSTSLPHRRRMLAATEARQIRVVVELDELGAPPKEHRVPRMQNGAHQRLKAAGPILRGTERRPAPIDRANELPGDSSSRQERKGSIGHVTRKHVARSR